MCQILMNTWFGLVIIFPYISCIQEFTKHTKYRIEHFVQHFWYWPDKIWPTSLKVVLKKNEYYWYIDQKFWIWKMLKKQLVKFFKLCDMKKYWGSTRLSQLIQKILLLKKIEIQNLIKFSELLFILLLRTKLSFKNFLYFPIFSWCCFLMTGIYFDRQIFLIPGNKD